MAERPYEKEDLERLNRAAVLQLVLKQRERWIGKSALNQRTTKQDLVAALLDPSSHFTTKNPRPLHTRSKARQYVQAAKATSSETRDGTSESSGTSTEMLPITVFITDKRFGTQDSCEITVPIVQKIGAAASTNHYKVSSKVIVAALEAKGKISGVVKLSCPHPVDATFPSTFLTCLSEPASSTEPEIPLLDIFKQRLQAVFYVTIEHASAAAMNRVTTSTGSLILDHNLRPLELAKQRAQDSQQSQRPKRENDDEIISWLRTEIQKKSGYAEFSTKFKNHRLQNSDIVKYWNFAAEILLEYSCQNYKHFKITRKHICKALNIGVGGTWLKQAENASRWIKAAADDPLVTAKLSEQSKVPSGSSQLYRYLLDWNANRLIN